MEQIIPVLLAGEFSKHFDFDRLKNFNLLRINIDLSFCKKSIFSQNVLLYLDKNWRSFGQRLVFTHIHKQKIQNKLRNHLLSQKTLI